MYFWWMASLYISKSSFLFIKADVSSNSAFKSFIFLSLKIINAETFKRIMGDTLIYFWIRQIVDIKECLPRMNKLLRAFELLEMRLSSIKSSMMMHMLNNSFCLSSFNLAIILLWLLIIFCNADSSKVSKYKSSCLIS